MYPQELRRWQCVQHLQLQQPGSAGYLRYSAGSCNLARCAGQRQPKLAGPAVDRPLIAAETEPEEREKELSFNDIHEVELHFRTCVILQGYRVFQVCIDFKMA